MFRNVLEGCTYRPFLRYAEGEGGGAATTTATPEAAVQAAAAAQQAATSAATTTAAAPAAWDGKIESLDPAAQKIITDLRKEAGDNRVKANAETERVKAILKAAGIVDEKDPVEALKAATAERDQFKATATENARKLAIFTAAGPLGADTAKLLDRTSFTTSIAGIDPSDGPAITAAIKAAIDADATLKAVRATGASSLDTSGGTGEAGQVTEEQLAHMSPDEIVEARKAGRLKTLMG